MHMADALISPAVGGTMWAVTAGMIVWCARKVKETRDDRLVPMMGVLGAFIFTTQMINFSIPVTGSSGHLGGALILAILLGPYAAFLVIASVLTVQALFFADGGLLALGCNIFNLGFFPAFIAYPLVYRLIAGNDCAGMRAWSAALVAGIIGLQLGAFGVVCETKLSGISELPFKTFFLIMQPIHLVIGVIEGLATAAVIAFVARVRPEALEIGVADARMSRSMNPILASLLLVAVVLGGVVSWFASTHPDGLEWAIAKVTGKEEFKGVEDGVHGKLAAMQKKTAFLPDYGFKADGVSRNSGRAGFIPATTEAGVKPALPVGTTAEGSRSVVNAGTSVSGIVGGLMTLTLTALIGFALKARKKRV